MQDWLKVAILLGTLGVAAYGQSSFDPGSPEVRELKALYAMSGEAFPTISFPLFREDLFRMATELEGRPGSDAVNERLTAFAGDFAPRKAPVVSMLSKVDYQQFFPSPGESETFPELVDIEHPLLDARLVFQSDNSVLLSIQDVSQKQYKFGIDTNNAPPSVTGNPFARENNSIHEGFLRFLAGPFNVVFGRQPVHFGPSADATISASDRLPFLDALRVQMTKGPLTMTLITSTLENRQAIPDPSEPGFGQDLILYNIHYFEWDFGRVKAGLGAQYLISRTGNNIQLADFFPVFSWHDADIAPNNMCLLGDITWVPLAGLSVALQFGLDDVNLSGLGWIDSGVPTIDAEVLDITYSFEPAPSWPVTLDLTGGHTHYLWGNFDFSGPYDNYLARAIYRIDLWANGVQEMPLTSPYGPGTWWVTASGRVDAPFGGYAGFRFSYVLLNPLANLVSTPYAASAAIANAALDPQVEASLTAGYHLGDWLTMEFSPKLRLNTSGMLVTLALSADMKLTSGGIE
jgi:hypothetical protein